MRMNRFVCKTKLEKAWIVASVTALVLHRLLEDEPNVSGALLLFEWAMILLSFPFGPVAMIFLAIVVESLGVYRDVSWLFDWSTLLFVGYIQWFWVLPEIRRNSQLLTLNLTSPVAIVSPVETISPIKITSPSEIAAPAAPPDASLTPPELPAPFVFDVAAFVPVLAEFDEAGLTALERVLRAQQTFLPAPASPSCVESVLTTARLRV